MLEMKNEKSSPDRDNPQNHGELGLDTGKGGIVDVWLQEGGGGGM